MGPNRNWLIESAWSSSWRLVTRQTAPSRHRCNLSDLFQRMRLSCSSNYQAGSTNEDGGSHSTNHLYEPMKSSPIPRNWPMFSILSLTLGYYKLEKGKVRIKEPLLLHAHFIHRFYGQGYYRKRHLLRTVISLSNILSKQPSRIYKWQIAKKGEVYSVELLIYWIWTAWQYSSRNWLLLPFWLKFICDLEKGV